MKRLSLALVLFAAPFAGVAQQKLLSIKADSVPVKLFIREVEAKTSLKFYFAESWLNSVFVSVHADDKPISDVLHSAFKDTKLHFYIDGQKVILTNNTPIIEGIDAGFFTTHPTQSEINFSFQKEDIPVHIEQKTGSRLIEIGRKQATVKGKPKLVGYVKDKKTNEPIAGASIYLEGLSVGATSNSVGFYSLSAPTGTYTVVIKYLGMIPEKRTIVLYSDGKLDFLLTEDVISLKEVVVESERDANASSTQMGKTTLDIKALKNVPKVLGENDILRLALMLPGVKSVGEGSAGLNVRGGNADQNLMILNEATIYNPSHFLGFFSVFNADAIRTSELYKSSIPTQYGGRLSSIFDIQLKDGNQKTFSGIGGVGPVSARLNLDVPLIKGKTSLTFGGRTTYSDWILRQIPQSQLSNANASFSDFVARVTHKMNEKNSLALSYYYSKDRYRLGNDSLFSYSNNLVSLQWSSRINDNLYGFLSVTHSGYQYNINYEHVRQNAFNLGFGLNESNAKWNFNYTRGVHKFDFGLQSKLYDLNPGFIHPVGDSSIVRSQLVQRERGLESALYLADNFDITPKFQLYVGLRFSSFTALGPHTIYSYSPSLPRDPSTISDSTTFKNNQPIKTFLGPEYRFSARYLLTAQSSIKFSYNRTRQYIHMMSNTIAVSPVTTWKLSDPNIVPQIGDQLSVGLYKNLNNGVEASVEGYYKWLDHVVDYKIGSDLILNKHIEQDVLQGTGRAYGIELLLRKRSGKLNGWIGYTYSRTFLRMNGASASEKINNGNYYPANYDKPHDVSVVANYKFTRRYSFSMNFVYNTGRPITYPIGLYQFDGGYKINYSDRNQFRIPDYIRLDLGVNIEATHKIKTLAHGYWSFSIYNVLGRRNPYSIYFKADSNGQIQGYKLSIFGAPIPTITYNFKF